MMTMSIVESLNMCSSSIPNIKKIDRNDNYDVTLICRSIAIALIKFDVTHNRYKGMSGVIRNVTASYFIVSCCKRKRLILICDK